MHRKSREVPAFRAVVEDLAHNPWFIRKVSPDATSLNVEFVWPIVIQAVCAVRVALHWPPPPMNDDSIEKLSGIPEFGRALDRAGVCKRDDDGIYDLSGLQSLLIFAVTSKLMTRRHKQNRRRENRKLGLRTTQRGKHGPLIPLLIWKPENP
jgi:hypothetical protein